MNKRTAARVAFPFAIILLTLSLYLSTLLPGISLEGDETKFQFIGKILGVPHTTGFPTYVLLNWLFVHLIPLKSIAWRVNLMSAVWASATCLALYFLLLKVTSYKLLSFATAILFSVTYTFWSFSLAARHYTLNLFFFCAIVFLLIKWHSERKNCQLYLALIIYSISLGNHPTIISLLPAIIYIIFVTDKKIFLDKKMLLVYFYMLAIVVALYSYVLIRSYQKAPYLEGRIYAFKDFIWYISGDYFRGDIFNFSMRKIPAMARCIFVESLLQKQLYSPILIALGGVGVLLYLQKNAKLCLFLILTIAPGLSWAIFSDYGVLPWRYFLTTYLLFVVFIGLGVYYILEFIGPRKIKKAVYSVAVLYLLLSIQLLISRNYHLVDRSKDTRMQEVIEKTLSHIDDNAIILGGTYDYFEAFSYYLFIDQRWKDKNIHLIHATSDALVKIRKCPRQGKQMIILSGGLSGDHIFIKPLNLPIYTLYHFPNLKVKRVVNIANEVDLYQVL